MALLAWLGLVVGVEEGGVAFCLSVGGLGPERNGFEWVHGVHAADGRGGGEGAEAGDTGPVQHVPARCVCIDWVNHQGPRQRSCSAGPQGMRRMSDYKFIYEHLSLCSPAAALGDLSATEDPSAQIALAAKLTQNVRLNIKNIHVRVEDTVSNPKVSRSAYHDLKVPLIYWMCLNVAKQDILRAAAANGVRVCAGRAQR